jgi:hypothetical protein
MSFEALALLRLMYALQSWAGFLTQELVDRIDAFLRHVCMQIVSQAVSFYRTFRPL